MTIETKQIQIIPVAGRIGAEIKGIQLQAGIDPTTFQEIKNALNQYKVVFFRDQHHLTDSDQEAFAKLLGDPYAHPTVPVKNDTNYIFELDSQAGAKANHWHTDVTFVPEVPKYSILKGVTIPNYGGDTVWANTNAAYEDLPKELKQLAEELWAIHTNEFDYARVTLSHLTNNNEEAHKYRSVFESNSKI